MSKLLPEGTYVGYPVGGAPPGPLKPPQGPQGVTEFWKKLQKFPKILWKLYMHQNTPNNNSKTHFGLLGLPGGALGGQKVILLGPRFFLVKSMWSFRQNILYLSQVSGLGGHGTWFWLLGVPIGLSPPPNQTGLRDFFVRWQGHTHVPRWMHKLCTFYVYVQMMLKKF